MARPSTFPVWTDGDPSKVTEPTSPVKLAGWTYLEEPPFEYMNWQLWLINEWLEYLDSLSPVTPAYSNVTANTTAAQPVTAYYANPTGGSFNLTLPAVSTNNAYRVMVKNVGFGSVNTVTVVRSGGDLIEGAATNIVLNQGDVVTLQANLALGGWLLCT